mmetsp:Transcript_22482/g.31352  ORF Transcript_22482/g.31352 Transcript_22482/m.31352 type:complete len:205 (+) Transcript_22482:98-712(+)
MAVVHKLKSPVKNVLFSTQYYYGTCLSHNPNVLHTTLLVKLFRFFCLNRLVVFSLDRYRCFRSSLNYCSCFCIFFTVLLQSVFFSSTFSSVGCRCFCCSFFFSLSAFLGSIRGRCCCFVSIRCFLNSFCCCNVRISSCSKCFSFCGYCGCFSRCVFFYLGFLGSSAATCVSRRFRSTSFDTPYEFNGFQLLNTIRRQKGMLSHA